MGWEDVDEERQMTSVKFPKLNFIPSSSSTWPTLTDHYPSIQEVSKPSTCILCKMYGDISTYVQLISNEIYLDNNSRYPPESLSGKYYLWREHHDAHCPTVGMSGQEIALHFVERLQGDSDWEGGGRWEVDCLDDRQDTTRLTHRRHRESRGGILILNKWRRNILRISRRGWWWWSVES